MAVTSAPDRTAGRAEESVANPRRWLVGRTVLMWLVSALVLGLWSLATPHLTAPDSPAHDLRAWGAGHGQVVLEDPGEVEGMPYASLGVNEVPTPLVAAAGSLGCYARQPDTSASCIADIGADDTRVTYLNPLGQYFPPYYLATGWPSALVNVPHALTADRAAAVLLASLFLAWALTAALTLPRPHLAATGVVIAASPQVLYFGGVLNPNSLEVMAALAMGACSLVYFTDPDGPLARAMVRRALLAATAVALTRMLSPLWLACWAGFLLIAFGLPGLRALFRRANWGWIALPLAACLGNVAWTVLRQGHVAGAEPTFTASFHDAFAASMAQIDGTNVAQVVGVFGWLDTGLRPGLVNYYLFAAVFLIGLCWLFLDRRASLALAAWVAVCYLLPVALQAYQWNDNGAVWQVRYTLPLLVLLPVSASFWAAQSPELTPALRARLGVIVPAVLALLGYVQVAAYATLLRRNISGMDGSLLDRGWEPWPGVIALLGAWTCTVVVVCAVLARSYWRDGRTAPVAQSATE